MTVRELKDYLNGWSDDAEVGIIVINSKTRKVYLHPKLTFITNSDEPCCFIDIGEAEEEGFEE